MHFSLEHFDPRNGLSIGRSYFLTAQKSKSTKLVPKTNEEGFVVDYQIIGNLKIIYFK